MSIKEKGKVVVCPECHKERCWRKGKTPGRGGVKQRFVCFDCGRTFYLPLEPKKKKAVSLSKFAEK